MNVLYLEDGSFFATPDGKIMKMLSSNYKVYLIEWMDEEVFVEFELTHSVECVYEKDDPLLQPYNEFWKNT